MQIPSTLLPYRYYLSYSYEGFSRQLSNDKQTVLITAPCLGELYKVQLEELNIQHVLLLEETTLDYLISLDLSNYLSKSLVLVAFGGGRVIDAVKYLANKYNCTWVSLPTSLSNDGIASSVIVNETRSGMKIRSRGRLPQMVWVNLSIIEAAPKELIYAGLGDLLGNYIALSDWKLAHLDTGETIHKQAYQVSRQALNQIDTDLPIDTINLSHLSSALLMSGFSMELAGSSRPASGAEHLISHAIDQYYPKKVSIHGLQVAYASLIIEKHFSYPETFSYDSYFSNQLKDVIFSHCDFTTRQEVRLLKKAVEIRPDRYTILHKHNKANS
jgi:glycerol-1-phosphate dehydrogenase [NAD(P)+]